MTKSKTYADYILSGGEPELKARDEKRSFCECGILSNNYQILDVRGSDEGEAAARSWACASCWTKWVRDDKSPLTRKSLARDAKADSVIVGSINDERL